MAWNRHCWDETILFLKCTVKPGGTKGCLKLPISAVTIEGSAAQENLPCTRPAAPCPELLLQAVLRRPPALPMVLRCCCLCSFSEQEPLGPSWGALSGWRVPHRDAAEPLQDMAQSIVCALFHLPEKRARVRAICSLRNLGHMSCIFLAGQLGSRGPMV